MSQHTLQSLLVTGGAGFIGSNFVRLILAERPGVKLVNYDALTYAGNMESIADLTGRPGYAFVRGDICDGAQVGALLREHKVDTIIHFAAESHVDRSILSAAEFVRTNVMGVQTLLAAAMEAGVGRFVQVSTDEVYGSLGSEGKFSETTPLAANSPYSASKAAGDLLCRAWFHTHGYPVLVDALLEQLRPLAVSGEADPAHDHPGAGRRRAAGLRRRQERARIGSHVEDHCRAVLTVAETAGRARSTTSAPIMSGRTSTSSRRCWRSWASPNADPPT